MTKLLLYSTVLLLFQLKGFASHIVGGEMYYDYLGNNQYRIYVALYRDCASTGAAYDDPLNVGVFDANNVRVMNVTIPFPGSVNLPVVFNNPCVTPPTGICTERAIYSTVVTLPPSAGGYTCSYQRCCRGPNVTNLDNPDDTGITLTTHIPGTNVNAVVNSSARFVNYPPLVICNNEDLNFNHMASDADGDSLAYELVTPFAGASSLDPLPIPIPEPFYPLVDWAGSFSAAVPLGVGSTTTINPMNGHLFVDANALGLYVVGIRVNEYRNGVLINSTTRDFLFRVVNCIVQLQAIVTEQEDMPGFNGYCNGLSFTFDNQSWGGNSYQWDFGDPGTTTDVSTAFEPSYTYPAPGIYEAMLVVNPGWPCTDTTYVTLNLNNPISVDFTYNDSLCFQDNAMDFAVLNPPAGASLSWNFGPNATPPTATTPTVSSVHFTTAGNHSVTLEATTTYCTAEITYNAFILPEPLAGFNLPTDYECLGLTQSFQNTSTGGTSYDWDFGVPGIITDVSTATNPTYTFPAAGTYTVTLIANVSQGCADTIQQQFTVYDPLSVSFTHNDSLCITNNSFDFVGTVTGPPITTYTWNFGPNATPSTSTALNVSGVVYDEAGAFPVTLTAGFLQCSQTAASQVFVFREPTIAFGMVEGLQCAPYPAYFRDSSLSDTPISYLWDFGDGFTSTEQHPMHLYENPGQYTVTLQITTTEGCATTLSLTKPGMITIHPTPVSDFDITPNETNICHSTISFIDHSEGALWYYYIFDDEGAVSQESDPQYTYLTDGMHYPMQIVINEFNCRDTSFQTLWIEPFEIYIPNTFTPDGDEFNNYFRAVAALDTEEWEMRIYNRWGELVFVSNDQYAEWDGTYKGLLAQEGMYSYKVKYISCAPGARWEELTGHFSLLR